MNFFMNNRCPTSFRPVLLHLYIT